MSIAPLRGPNYSCNSKYFLTELAEEVSLEVSLDVLVDNSSFYLFFMTPFSSKKLSS